MDKMDATDIDDRSNNKTPDLSDITLPGAATIDPASKKQESDDEYDVFKDL